MAKKLLVVSNCNTGGLGNSLSMLMPDAEVHQCDIWSYRAASAEWNERARDFDHLIVLPELAGQGLDEGRDGLGLIWTPSFLFRSFHPDLCYMHHGAIGAVQGPMKDYHSSIVVAAYMLGLPASDVAALFRDDVFAACGFYDIFVDDRRRMLENFSDHGFDMSTHFLRWMRGRPFMYSINHPAIEPLFCLAWEIVRKLGKTPVLPPQGYFPIDRLADSLIYPIFPEIAERLGYMGGTTWFKPFQSNTLLSLDQFIHQSYECYQQVDMSQVDCGHPEFAHIQAVVRSLA
ncbi:hypothetical protein J2W40_000078 [Sphingobium xenophagum]|uniref:Polysaccharide biosynthesis enzyme WcbI domain-containing protein n=1 Tax=Sphingobium xenophagum TaxID=121428 RepID=A0ABU1WVS5_SPHXE|nr:WcbI family polysaccharide biosynthesis putative acetyltransferase [Sphingobium xenophagum]MDR7153284.1 hypothetical protein [Sphingobium xenophagum]